MLQSQTLQFMYTVPAVWHYSKLLFAVPTNSKAYCVCYQQVGYQHITFMLIIVLDMLGKY